MIFNKHWRSGNRRKRSSGVVWFPQHLQDTRKALRHHKAGNHAVIATEVGNQRGSLTFERVGLPALLDSAQITC